MLNILCFQLSTYLHFINVMILGRKFVYKFFSHKQPEVGKEKEVGLFIESIGAVTFGQRANSRQNGLVFGVSHPIYERSFDLHI